MTKLSVDFSDLEELTMIYANKQPYISNSPCELDKDEKVLLCAASCIAAAGLKLLDSVYESDFIKSISLSGDKSIVEGAFGHIGIDHVVCKKIMMINDAEPLKNRLSKLENGLKEISTDV